METCEVGWAQQLDIFNGKEKWFGKNLAGRNVIYILD